MKIIGKLSAVAIIACLASSCSKTTVPQYTSIENVLEVRPGISYDKLRQILGIDAFDLYSDQDNGITIYIFNYKHIQRKESLALMRKEEGLTSGKKYYVEPSRVYFIFQEGRLTSMVTDAGREDGAEVLMLNNIISGLLADPEKYNIYQIEEDAEEEEKEKAKTQQSQQQQQPVLKSYNNRSYSMKYSSGVKRKSAAGAFFLSYIFPGMGQFYAKKPAKGVIMMVIMGGSLGMAIAGYGSSAVSISGYSLLAGNWLWSVVDAPISAKKYNQNMKGASLLYLENEKMRMSLRPVSPYGIGGSFSLRF